MRTRKNQNRKSLIAIALILIMLISIGYAALSTTYDGWYVGASENPGSTDIGLSGKEGYNNTLYYPHKEGIDSNKCYGYWLASPSAYSYRIVFCVYYNGNVDGHYYYNTYMAGRPVVSLPSNIINQ